MSLGFFSLLQNLGFFSFFAAKVGMEFDKFGFCFMNG